MYGPKVMDLQEMKLLKCPYCNETLLRNSQGLSIDVKRKHLNKYVKEM